MSAHRGCSSVGRALAWHARGRRFESDQLHQYLDIGCVICSGRMTHSMADIAQLVRALVCGTKCRRFESGYPPHYKNAPQRGVFYYVWAVRTRTAGSSRSDSAGERGPWSVNEHGNLQSGYPPHI